MKKKSLEPTVKRQRKSGLVYTTLAQEFLKAARPHIRAIKRISEMAQVPISRVSSDVIEIGIAAVMGNYKPMIEMETSRKIRAEKIKQMFGVNSLDEKINVSYGSQASETTGPGSPKESTEMAHEDELRGEGAGPANGATLDFSGATLVRPGDALEQPGYELPPDPSLAGVSPDGEIVIER